LVIWNGNVARERVMKKKFLSVTVRLGCRTGKFFLLWTVQVMTLRAAAFHQRAGSKLCSALASLSVSLSPSIQINLCWWLMIADCAVVGWFYHERGSINYASAARRASVLATISGERTV
jgi:hypothetical protein